MGPVVISESRFRWVSDFTWLHFHPGSHHRLFYSGCLRKRITGGDSRNHFNGTTAVSFGGIAAQSFTVDSENQITAVVDAGASGAISVTTPGGAGTRDGFSFVPVPIIDSFSPTSGGMDR